MLDSYYKYIFIDFINEDNLDWNSLSKNPNAIHILENKLDKVCWYYISKNPKSISILEQNMDYTKSYNKILLKKVYNYKKIWEINKKTKYGNYRKSY